MTIDLEILLIGNPLLNLLSYMFVILLIFNLLKVNYLNPIVAVFLKMYRPISKILFLSTSTFDFPIFCVIFIKPNWTTEGAFSNFLDLLLAKGRWGVSQIG